MLKGGKPESAPAIELKKLSKPRTLRFPSALPISSPESGPTFVTPQAREPEEPKHE